MITKIKNKIKNKKIIKAQRKEYLRTLPSAFDEAIYKWLAPEFITHQRGRLWKVIIPGLLLAAVIIGAVHKAWTFSLAIVIFALVYLLIFKEKPQDVEVKVSNIGVKVGGRKYPYNRIKAFWIIYEPPFVKTLNLRVSGEFIVDVVVQLNEQDPAEIREYLIEKIPEYEGKTESITDIFLRLFKI